jgi:hypothetical protein
MCIITIMAFMPQQQCHQQWQVNVICADNQLMQMSDYECLSQLSATISGGQY